MVLPSAKCAHASSRCAARWACSRKPASRSTAAISWLSCGGIGAQVYCAGGVADDEYTDAWRYDPASDTWSPLPNLPVDLWGSQYASAGGMLVLAGGVTGGSTSVTNRTVGFDPVAGAWRNLPNAQFNRYRGAAACGAYKIGGSPSSFVGSADSERLGGPGRLRGRQ